MKEAIIEAKKAYSLDEIPVGCVIVYQDKIIARGHNLRQTKKCSLDHAEIMAIKQACENLDSWILEGATIYVTIEPCVMCAGAIIQSRISRLVYGAKQPRFGCVESKVELFQKGLFNVNIEVEKGICEDEIELMMKTFFHEMRQNKENN